jgi:hypothetical protein
VLVDTASKVPRRGAARGAAEEKAERPRPDSDGTIIAVVALVDRSIRLVVVVGAGVFRRLLQGNLLVVVGCCPSAELVFLVIQPSLKSIEA